MRKYKREKDLLPYQITQKDVATVKIGGKVYSQHSFPRTKREALKDMKKLHLEGYYGRTLKVSDVYGRGFGYVIYKRKT